MPSLKNWGDGLRSFVASHLSPHTYIYMEIHMYMCISH